MAAQGKRTAAGDSASSASHNAEEHAGTRYQGRRAAPKTRGIKLPVLSVPSIVRPIIGKPAVAASVALASIVGVSVTAVAANNSAQVAEGKVVDLSDAVGSQETTSITVAASSTDEAVMNAAEVLNDDAVLSSEDKSVIKAAKKLESLLDEISVQSGSVEVSTGAEATSRDAQDSASRSFSRSTISGDSVTDSEGVASETDGVSTVADSADGSTAEGAVDAESLGITVRAVGSLEDVATENHSGDGNASSDSAVGSILNDYTGKHAAGGAHAATDEDSAQTSVQVAAQTQADDAAVDSATLDSVVAATEKLRSLVNGEDVVAVASATEVAQTELEKTWAKANELTEKVASYSNGQIPLSSLVELETASGQYLRADAALMFGEMNTAFKAEFGRNIKMTDSYRSYSVQVATKANKGWLAAQPGTSNHGWGLALDLSGPEAQWSTEQRNWLVEHSKEFGWISPDWAQSSKPEPWHWEYAGADVSSVATSGN